MTFAIVLLVLLLVSLSIFAFGALSQIMSNLDVVTEAINSLKLDLATKIAAVDQKIEELFAIIQAGTADGGITSQAADTLTAALNEARDTLAGALDNALTDDPNIPPVEPPTEPTVG